MMDRKVGAGNNSQAFTYQNKNVGYLYTLAEVRLSRFCKSSISMYANAKKNIFKKNLIDEQKHSSKKVWYKNINLEANPS